MRAAVAFLTPLGGAAPPRPGTAAWFAPVGAAIGGAVGGIWWLGDQWWSAPLGAALAVAADLALTGMLHIDGLADSADGLLPHLDRERRFEVMAEPAIGAFGVTVIAVVVLLRFAALTSQAPDPLALAGAWTVSRALMALTLSRGRPARAGGLSAAFVDARTAPAALAGALAGGALLVVAAGLVGALVAAGEMAAFGAVLLLAQRRLGGFTGDVLGAAGVVAETAALVLLVP